MDETRNVNINPKNLNFHHTTKVEKNAVKLDKQAYPNYPTWLLQFQLNIFRYRPNFRELL